LLTVPSPIGHALGAIAAGTLAVGKAPARELIRRSLWLAAFGIAPDLDLLIGRHSAETHSVGAAALVGFIAAWFRCPVASSRTRIWLAVTLAWMSHPVLDWLGSDDSLPLGVMMFWPLSQEYVYAGAGWFAPITRRYWLPGFLEHTAMAIVRETVLLGPLAAGALFVTWRRLRAAPPTDRRI
jgi:inner membrane protein